MKKLLFICAGLISALYGVAQERKGAFEVKGTITGKPDGTLVFLSYGNNGMNEEESCPLKGGLFAFRGNISEPILATLSNDGDGNRVSFYLDPGAMNVRTDFKDLIVTGSASEDEYRSLEDVRSGIKAELHPLIVSYEESNQQYLAAVKAQKQGVDLEALNDRTTGIRDRMAPLNEKLKATSLYWFRTHPQSYVTAVELQKYSEAMSADTLSAYIKGMDGWLQSTVYGQALTSVLSKKKDGATGSLAQLFITKDMNGAQVSLPDYKGKYLLLDFWGSWCLPCRKNNAHLRDMYAKYQSRGFEIIGIADNDSNPAEWRKAIDKDGIGAWKQVLRGLDPVKFRADGKPQPADINNMYGIYSVPTQILVDPAGVIIGRYGGTEEDHNALDQKLAEVIK
jgi:thiol-disulfide isomerase/thioredoxin